MNMAGNYLLDTNILIALFNEEEAILAKIQAADSIHVESHVIGELYFGAYNSGRIEENLQRIDEFVEAKMIIRTDYLTSKFYGEIKAQLKRNGTPIPENDIWIAAITKQYNLTLASRDQHFDKIENFNWEIW